MVVPRYADRLRNPLILDCRFQYCAGVDLSHAAALDFLPGRLVWGNRIAAGLLQLATPRHQNFIADENVRLATAKVDAHAIPGSQQCEPAARSSFR